MLRTRKIFVLGSANMDLVFALSQLPREGETLAAGDLEVLPGGKGANQACAAARLGGRTIMIACVGNDAFGSQLQGSMGEAGVDISRVRQSSRPTGCACIYVLPNGENAIVISPGANASLDAPDAVADLADIGPQDILLTQLETPLETIQAAVRHAKARGAITILDPAPARSLPPGTLDTIDFVTPNQTETATLLGHAYSTDTLREAAVAAERILGLGPKSVILKLGELGCVFSDGARQLAVEAFRVNAVDTTAAGDVFNGALAVGLMEEMPMADTLRFATAAAAISVTRRGAQPSIPSRAEVEAMLATVVAGRF